MEEKYGHIFCYSSVADVKKTNEDDAKIQCPICKTYSVSTQTERIIASLNVKCKYYAAGCQQTIAFGVDCKNYMEHINTCTYGGVMCENCKELILPDNKDTHSSVCPETLVKCAVDEKCLDQFRRKEIKEHESKCNYRLVSCDMKFSY